MTSETAMGIALTEAGQPKNLDSKAAEKFSERFWKFCTDHTNLVTMASERKAWGGRGASQNAVFSCIFRWPVNPKRADSRQDKTTDSTAEQTFEPTAANVRFPPCVKGSLHPQRMTASRPS